MSLKTTLHSTILLFLLLLFCSTGSAYPTDTGRQLYIGSAKQPFASVPVAVDFANEDGSEALQPVSPTLAPALHGDAFRSAEAPCLQQLGTEFSPFHLSRPPPLAAH